MLTQLKSVVIKDDWVEQAVCSTVDPELWFPEKGGSTRDAIRVCQLCEVREQCLKYALDNDERFGVWGGYSEQERRRMQLGLSPHMPAPEPVARPKKPEHKPEHGLAGYKRGCKCPVCRAGWAEYQREYARSRRPLRLCRECGGQITGKGPRTHCDDCRVRRGA